MAHLTTSRVNLTEIGISQPEFPSGGRFFEILKLARTDANIKNSELSARNLPGQILEKVQHTSALYAAVTVILKYDLNREKLTDAQIRIRKCTDQLPPCRPDASQGRILRDRWMPLPFYP